MRQQVREARKSLATVSLLRAEHVPLWENTIGISHDEVSQFVAVCVYPAGQPGATAFAVPPAAIPATVVLTVSWHCNAVAIGGAK